MAGVTKRAAPSVIATVTSAPAWAKALTTHHNLATGFNEALALAVAELGISKRELLSQVDSVRYATTLGTNALIERRGPRIGLLVTAGFDSTVPLSRSSTRRSAFR